MYRLPSLVQTTAHRLVLRTPLHYRILSPILVSSLASQSNRRYLNTMDAQDIKAYLADSPPSVVRLEIAKHFEALTDKQKRYAHYISK